MSKKCAKCDKTVYPIEELKCLDKSWHKACFKCGECGMVLNMKNYKGYNKIPYCNAHYPTTKHTAVADTPENRRLAKNTAIQSQVKYHADFEKNIKGSKIQVADDPETRRNQLLTKMVSGVEYRGHRDTVQEMESRRDQGGQPAAGENHQMAPRPVSGGLAAETEDAAPSPYSNRNSGHSTAYTQQGKVEQQARSGRVGSIADYDPANEHWGSLAQGYHPLSATQVRQEWEDTIPEPRQNNAKQPPEPEPATVTAPPPPQDNAQHYPPPSNQQPPAHYPPPSQHQPPPQQHHQPPAHYPAPSQPQMPPQQMQQPRMPPPQMQPPQMQQPQRSLPHIPVEEPQRAAPPAQPAQAPPASQPGGGSGQTYQAMYDYEAQDDDEVGFIDGDLILDCQAIDEGWMFGTVRRTGQRGMLPANYVEPMAM